MLRRALLLVLLVTGAQAGHGGDPDWSAASEVQVAEAEMPADIEIAPDGSLWFAEVYAGNVWRVADEAVLMHDVDVVGIGDERGLAGLALAHDHDESGAYYLYYTKPDEGNGTNHLVRVEGDDETLLLTVPGAPEHNGGRIVAAPDGTLYVTTGENQLRDPAQDLGSLLGKVLRINPDGSAADGNLEGLIYSYGHRNPYGLALDAETDRLWSTENSGWRRDEVNVIEPGANYGYPECEGEGLNGVDTPCPRDKGYTFPAMTFYEDRTAAPTGAAFWNGGFYWGSLREGSIHHTWQDGDTWHDEIVHEHGPAILDIAVGPQGHLYFSDIEGVWRLSFPGEPQPTLAPSGQGNDPGGQDVPFLPIAVIGLAAIALAARRR